LFDEPQIVRSLERLSLELRVAFAASCAERVFSAYDSYSNRTGRGKPAALRSILNRLWNDLVGDRMTEGEVHATIKACEELHPREEDRPWMPEKDYAEDAVAAAAYALRCRENGSAQEAAWAARRAYEAVDSYVMGRDNPDLETVEGETQVLTDPLVQAELARQRRDLDELHLVLHGDQMRAVLRFQQRASEESPTFFGPVS
jgi:uncharacterized protein YjaG (DUF416 family)